MMSNEASAPVPDKDEYTALTIAIYAFNLVRAIFTSIFIDNTHDATDAATQLNVLTRRDYE